MTTVERPLTIAVSGAHSTGKSTFPARLAHELRRDGFEVASVADLGEQAQRLGLPLLYHHTYASTLWIITRGISNEVATWAHADVPLVDRAVPDALGYYRAALDYRGEQPDPDRLAHLRALAVRHSTHYDLTYRTTIDRSIPLGSDKPRDENRRYRRLADHHVGHVLDELGIAHELLPADGHDAAIRHARVFTAHHLAGNAATATLGLIGAPTDLTPASLAREEKVDRRDNADQW